MRKYNWKIARMEEDGWSFVEEFVGTKEEVQGRFEEIRNEHNGVLVATPYYEGEMEDGKIVSGMVDLS